MKLSSGDFEYVEGKIESYQKSKEPVIVVNGRDIRLFNNTGYCYGGGSQSVWDLTFEQGQLVKVKYYTIKNEAYSPKGTDLHCIIEYKVKKG